MDNYLSNKFRIAGLIATFMVIFRHSLNMEAFFGSPINAPIWLREIEQGWSTITECAVPYFFAVSGFFFFRRPIVSFSDWFLMLQNKLKSLFVPFILWNIVGAFVIFLSGRFVFEDNNLDYVIRLLNSDYDGVLWYIRNLMLLMLFSPLYGWLFKINHWGIYIPLLVFLIYWWWPVEMTPWSSEGILFFFIGGIIQKKIDLTDIHVSPIFLIISIFLILVMDFSPLRSYMAVRKISVLLSIVSFWQLIELIPLRIKELIVLISKHGFFMFAFHQFVIKAMKVTLAHYFFNSGLVAIIAYFVLPILTFCILYFVGVYWKKLMPRIYSLFVGGRA